MVSRGSEMLQMDATACTRTFGDSRGFLRTMKVSLGLLGTPGVSWEIYRTLQVSTGLQVTSNVSRGPRGPQRVFTGTP